MKVIAKFHDGTKREFEISPLGLDGKSRAASAILKAKEKLTPEESAMSKSGKWKKIFCDLLGEIKKG